MGVKRRCGVNELHAGGEVDVALAGVAAEPGGAEGHHRPETLSARCDDVRGELRNEHHRAFHVVKDDAVDGAQIVRDQSVKRLQRGPGGRLP